MQMKLCQDHWAELRKAIEDRGLGGFVSPDGEEAARRMKLEQDNGGRSRESFEPLLQAHNSIMINAVRIFLGCEGCPICNADNSGWVIERAADDVLETAKELGVMGSG